MEKMNTRYSITLGDGMWAPSLSAQIEETFLPLFGGAGKPVDMAIFTRNEIRRKIALRGHSLLLSCSSWGCRGI